MDSTALLSVVGGLFLLSIVILSGLCLHCKGNSQTKYTQQYQQSSQLNQGFTVIRPHAENPLTTTLPTQTSLHQLVTSPLLPDPRRHSACPSSNGSDYVNQNEDDDFDDGPGYEIPPEKKEDDPEYLDVLPDDPHQSQHSLASSANSGPHRTIRGQNYENVTEIHILPRDGDVYVVDDEDDDDDDNDDDDDDDDDDQQYINVHQPNIDFQTPVGSYGSSDGQDSSDYVNAPVQITINLGD